MSVNVSTNQAYSIAAEALDERAISLERQAHWFINQGDETAALALRNEAKRARKASDILDEVRVEGYEAS